MPTATARPTRAATGDHLVEVELRASIRDAVLRCPPGVLPELAALLEAAAGGAA